MRIFYLGFEIATREFLSNLYLSIKLLEQKSVDKVVITNNLILKYLFYFKLLPKGVIFHKSAQLYTLKYLKKLKRKGFFNILQDAESVCDQYEDDEIDCFMKPNETLRYVDLVCAINQEELDGIKKNNPISRIENTGFNRFWPLKDNKYMKAFCGEEAEEIKKKYGKHILYISSASSYRYHYKRLNLDQLYNNLRYIDGMSESHSKLMLKWAEYGQYSFFSFLEFIRLLNEKYSNDIVLIYRPHPSEDIEFISHVFNSIPYIKVSLENTLYASILAADSVITSTLTTTIFDAYFSNKLVNIFTPYSNSDYYKKLIKHKSFKLGRVSKSPKDLLEKVTDDIFNKNIKKNFDLLKDPKYKLENKDVMDSESSKFTDIVGKLSFWNNLQNNQFLMFLLPFNLRFFINLYNFYLKVFSIKRSFKYLKHKDNFNFECKLASIKNKYSNLEFKIIKNSLIITRNEK